MCGIAGIIDYRDGAPLAPALDAMVRAQWHRGPDDGGAVVLPFGRGRLGLGHRRLSIIDTSAAGHQPMADPDSGNYLSFNGEIYNFRALREELRALGVAFRSHGDTEVLLRALGVWGADALARLQGMYALAFYHAASGRLLLARDPMGIKPLYRARHAGGLVFASEARAILASGLAEPRIDRRGLAGMLAYGAVQHPLTVFEGIHSLPPGCYQIFDADTHAAGHEPPCRPFWRCPAANPRRQLGETLEDIRNTLYAAVQDHLVADVPVGVFLSSGLDSTVVAALASHSGNRLRGFTVGFADQPDFCEFAEAAATAAEFGLEHTQVAIGEADALAATQAWLASQDLPSIDGLNTYVISRAVRAHGIAVALSGLGGDELFGGYPSFVEVPNLRNTLWPARLLPGFARRALADLATLRKPLSVRHKLRDMLSTDMGLLALYLQRRRLLSGEFLRDLGVEPRALDLAEHCLPPESFEGLAIDERQPAWTVSQLESRFYQGNTLLRDSDANGMAHGLEIRVPMLDARMLELMGGVPDAVRLPNGQADKHLLQRAFAPMLRPALRRRGKLGFTLPIRRWMTGPLREHCEASMACLKDSGLLRPEGVDRVWREFLADPESPMWSRAFALSVLGGYLGGLERGNGANA